MALNATVDAMLMMQMMAVTVAQKMTALRGRAVRVFTYS